MEYLPAYEATMSSPYDEWGCEYRCDQFKQGNDPYTNPVSVGL